MPIFSFTEVFARPIGETSDVMTKEMCIFADHGGKKITFSHGLLILDEAGH